MSVTSSSPQPLQINHQHKSNRHLNDSCLHSFLKSDRSIYYSKNGISHDVSISYSTSMLANAFFFSHLVYGKKYFATENRSPEFVDRWQSIMGSLDDKVVVDVGCGPGNLFAALGGNPKTLIGVDISEGALLHAKSLGYVTLLADAQDMPLVSGFADIVMLNAVMHHVDDMEAVLREAARLVRPGGLLITDMDPQKGAWDFKGLGLLLYQLRYPLYKFLGSSSYKTQEEHYLRLATEVHNRQPGNGVSLELYEKVLTDLNFQYQINPHNHFIGREVLDGKVGEPAFRFKIGQYLSGIKPGTRKSGLSVMCFARRN